MQNCVLRAFSSNLQAIIFTLRWNRIISVLSSFLDRFLSELWSNLLVCCSANPFNLRTESYHFFKSLNDCFVPFARVRTGWRSRSRSRSKYRHLLQHDSTLLNADYSWAAAIYNLLHVILHFPVLQLRSFRCFRPVTNRYIISFCFG